LSDPVSSVTFIIPVRNDRVRLERCLRTIHENSHLARPDIIVVDNGSTDGSAEAAAAAGARVIVLAGPSVAELRNRAAAAATAELLAFVDADHEIAPGWLEAAVETLQDARVAAVGAPYHNPPDGTWVQRIYGGFRLHVPGRREVKWLASGNLVIRRAAFEGIGGFDAALESCEDVDLCYRLRATGARIVADPRMKSIHMGDPRTIRAVFASELWRGRDNFRVSFRVSESMRDLISVMVPLVHLSLAVAFIAGLALVVSGGWRVVFVPLFIAAGLSAVRALILIRRLHEPRFKTALQAFAVVGAYDAGRALGLLARATHETRTSHTA
jgi:glycosyltransferase involved in cell wall biosynthesis